MFRSWPNLLHVVVAEESLATGRFHGIDVLDTDSIARACHLSGRESCHGVIVKSKASVGNAVTLAPARFVVAGAPLCFSGQFSCRRVSGQVRSGLCPRYRLDSQSRTALRTDQAACLACGSSFPRRVPLSPFMRRLYRFEQGRVGAVGAKSGDGNHNRQSTGLHGVHQIILDGDAA